MPTAVSPSRIRDSRRACDHGVAHAIVGPRHEHSGRLVELVDRAAGVGLRQLDCVGDDGHQHGLEVQRGADRLADFPERAHFLDGARERLGARLELLEQPHVLDGDHRLIGEGVKQLDVLCGKRRPPVRATRRSRRWDGRRAAAGRRGWSGRSPPAPTPWRHTARRPRYRESGKTYGPRWRGRSRFRESREAESVVHTQRRHRSSGRGARRGG